MKSGIPLQVSNKCVVASIQLDLTDGLLSLFRSELLDYISKHEAKGIILDLSGLDIIDLIDWQGIRRTIDMAKMMGFLTVICGIQAGVAASLVTMDANIDKINSVANLDEAFEKVDSLSIVHKESDQVEKDDSVEGYDAEMREDE